MYLFPCLPGSPCKERLSGPPMKEGLSGSPMKEGASADQSYQSLGLSLLASPDSSYSCYSVVFCSLGLSLLASPDSSYSCSSVVFCSLGLSLLASPDSSYSCSSVVFCSLGLSLLASPDSSYSCYSVNPVTGSPCCCRRSPRLLNNGYYVLTEDSYSWDHLGNVSLTPSKINVSYKENLRRIFRRRRRARRSLSSLLSDMTETCQSWLGDKVFGEGCPSPLAESSWIDHSLTELDSNCSFSYDHTEIISPPGKLSDEPLPQQEICTETCHSQEQVTQCVGGLSEVPPPSAFCCCVPPEPQSAGQS
ncbi:transmembrane protein 71 [Aplochiton taeniatus]